MNGRVGYRFHPTDEELVSYFLKHKIQGHDCLVDDDIHLVDICKFDPWDLPGFASQGSDDQVWYFFYKRELKYKNSIKPRYNRSTRSGHWKPTGAERLVKAKRTRKVIGIKKTLVFYLRGAPKEVKTNWVIHEYEPKPGLPYQADLVLCKLKEKADDKADSSGCDEGESACNDASEFESNQIAIPVSEVNQEILLESIRASQGVNFRDPSEHRSQFLEEGISIDDLMLPDEVFYNDSNGMATELDTNDPEEDPNEMADSFLNLQYEYDDDLYMYAHTSNHSDYSGDNSARTHHNTSSSQQPLSGVFLKDMDADIVVGRSFQSGASNLNIRQRTSKEHRQTQRVQTLTETLPPSRYEQSATAKNHVRRDDILVMEASSADSITYPAEQIKFIGVAGNGHPVHVRQSSSRSGNVLRRVQLQGNFSSLSDQKGKETRKHVDAVNFPQESRKESIIVKTEKDREAVTDKASLKSRTDEMEGNKKIGSFIRMETSPLSRIPSPPSVYIVNVFIGLVLFIVAITQVLILR